MDLTCDCYNCIICNFRLQHLQHLQTHRDREHRQPHTAGQKDRNVHDRRDYHSKVCITMWHNHRQSSVGCSLCFLVIYQQNQQKFVQGDNVSIQIQFLRKMLRIGNCQARVQVKKSRSKSFSSSITNLNVKFNFQV